VGVGTDIRFICRPAATFPTLVRYRPCFSAIPDANCRDVHEEIAAYGPTSKQSEKLTLMLSHCNFGLQTRNIFHICFSWRYITCLYLAILFMLSAVLAVVHTTQWLTLHTGRASLVPTWLSKKWWHSMLGIKLRLVYYSAQS